VKNWIRRRIVDPLLELPRRGMSPDRLALSVALGVVIGNIPILGVSTILCAAIALVFRLNLPAIQIAQAAMAPSQLILMIPFLRMGEWLARAPRQPLSIKAAIALTEQGQWRAAHVLWDVMVHAGLAWMLIAPFATILFYAPLTVVFRRAAALRARP
jgi:uncharacterized protein (DUF2062 family)